ncbi:MAG: hypothetical protein IPK99_09775 [Flavobacteriales bacterium]|nr:hypothetical protein [Flavobacteriales bacterium]
MLAEAPAALAPVHHGERFIEVAAIGMCERLIEVRIVLARIAVRVHEGTHVIELCPDVQTSLTEDIIPYPPQLEPLFVGEPTRAAAHLAQQELIEDELAIEEAVVSGFHVQREAENGIIRRAQTEFQRPVEDHRVPVVEVEPAWAVRIARLPNHGLEQSEVDAGMDVATQIVHGRGFLTKAACDPARASDVIHQRIEVHITYLPEGGRDAQVGIAVGIVRKHQRPVAFTPEVLAAPHRDIEEPGSGPVHMGVPIVVEISRRSSVGISFAGRNGCGLHQAVQMFGEAFGPTHAVDMQGERTVRCAFHPETSTQTIRLMHGPPAGNTAVQIEQRASPEAGAIVARPTVQERKDRLRGHTIRAGQGGQVAAQVRSNGGVPLHLVPMQSRRVRRFHRAAQGEQPGLGLEQRRQGQGQQNADPDHG